MAMKRYKPSLSIGTKTLLSHLTLAIVVTTLASVLSYALSSHYIRQTRVNELMVAQVDPMAIDDPHLRRYMLNFLEIITAVILVVLLKFLDVEKHIEKEQAEIKARKTSEV